MKLLSILSIFLGISLSFCFGQHNNELYNNAALNRIQAGVEVHVLGDVHMYGAAAKFENNRLLKSDFDLYVDSLIQQREIGMYNLIIMDVTSE